MPTIFALRNRRGRGGKSGQYRPRCRDSSQLTTGTVAGRVCACVTWSLKDNNKLYFDANTVFCKLCGVKVW